MIGPLPHHHILHPGGVGYSFARSGHAVQVCRVAQGADSTQKPTHKASPASWVWWVGVWYGQISVTSDEIFSVTSESLTGRKTRKTRFPHWFSMSVRCFRGPSGSLPNLHTTPTQWVTTDVLRLRSNHRPSESAFGGALASLLLQQLQCRLLQRSGPLRKPRPRQVVNSFLQLPSLLNWVRSG